MRSSSYRGARASLPTATPSTISAWIENGGSASDRPLAFHGRLLLGAACEDRVAKRRADRPEAAVGRAGVWAIALRCQRSELRRHGEPGQSDHEGRDRDVAVARELVVDRGAPSRDQARPCDHPTKGGKSREAE